MSIIGKVDSLWRYPVKKVTSHLLLIFFVSPDFALSPACPSRFFLALPGSPNVRKNVLRASTVSKAIQKNDKP